MRGSALVALGSQGASLPRLHEEVQRRADQEGRQPETLHTAGPGTLARAWGLS